MTVTRSQTGTTPRKSLPDGFVETPGRKGRSASRKSQANADRSPSPEEAHTTGVNPVVEIGARERKAAEKEIQSNLNGQANGHANGHANRKPKGRIIDGWLEGGDPKVDMNPHFDFGGSWGVSAMMVGFPTLMWYMWIGATYYDGYFPSEPNMTWSEFGQHMAHLVYTGAFPHAKAWTIYWVFLIVQGFFYLTLPGVYATGKPLPHEGGKQLRYYCNGVYAFYLTIVLAVAAHFTGVFKLYTLMDEFGPLMSVAIISGFIVSVIAYISAFARGAQHRMTGYHVYDFFMGAELNPRMFGWLDFKMFFEIRLPWYILFLITLSAAARQWENNGYVSGEVGFLLMAHFLYANACCKGEEMIVVTWDMYYEKWGFMLVFWNLAGVPLSYCHCTIYLANHHPSVYAWPKPFLVFLYVSYLFVYYVWDTSQSQKAMFRARERGYQTERKSFPQLPWKEVKNPRKIMTDTGDSILVDGWYGYARKIHYTCDVYFALTWGLVTGFRSPFPWFYPAFFFAMIVHRATRDVQRCRQKYGEAWAEYERLTPYLFIPYVV
ncbi:C-24(28) sterol reductase [Teratosphaeriaceae sp. CCFEE 6253]|nr:C-24(28) sterol reductase [Teratosphaeriaceae sp. CCFEE 6253]